MSKLTFFYIFLIYIIQFSVEIEFPIVLTTWAAEPFQEATGRGNFFVNKIKYCF